MNKLLFIDTNIYLDFYRNRSDAGASLLDHLDSIRSKIIVTYQIEMEFKKHRQNEIKNSISQLKSPEKISRPGILSEDKTFRALTKNIKKTDEQIKKLKARLSRIFEDPSRYDPVYKVTQRIFHKKDSYNLTRANKVKNRIRRQAWRRFILGYPPRKISDTSMGDAINWEWIVEVALQGVSEIYIVSRDSDYGITFNSKSYLNDWLLHEFKDRTTRHRKIHLSNSLSNTLKQFEVPVTREEEEWEAMLIEHLGFVPNIPKEELEKQIKEVLSKKIADGEISFL